MPRLYVRSAQTLAKRYHVSLMAMGCAPSPGFSSPIKSPSSRQASRGSSRDKMRMTSSRVPSRTTSEDWQAAQIISNVHPDGPATVPRWYADTIHTTSCSCSQVSCSAGSAASNGAAGAAAGCSACKLAKVRGSRVSAAFLPCSARAAWWIERF